MQTFLPYPSFLASATALDDRRLGKQRVETFQILRALVFPTYGWKNHPAVAMWRGFSPALVSYGLTVCREWERRGYADAVAGALLDFTGGTVPQPDALRAEGRLPPWLGDEAVHASHRSALLRKDSAYYGELFESVPNGPVPVAAELPYEWPRPLFPRWPVRRSGRLPMVDALAAARLDGDPDAARMVGEAVAALQDGAAAAVATAPTALAVLLALDPPGLWVTDNPDVRVDAPAPNPSPVPQNRPPGRLSASIARPPTEADAEAMRAEASADLGLIVYPLERLADPVVADMLAAMPPAVVVSPTAEGFRLHQDWRQTLERLTAVHLARASSPHRTGGSPAGSTPRRPPRQLRREGRS